ncbi:MAG: response regulator [Bacteroidales bacterium]
MSKVLIVDDNLKNLQLLSNLLSSNGYSIEYAINGTEALLWVEKVKFDIVLLDLMMPDIDGFEVCKRIKAIENYCETPVIFLTAKNDVESITRGFKSGGVDYISKPFNTDELLVRVKNHIELKESKDKLRDLNNWLNEQVALKTNELVKQNEEYVALNSELRDLNEALTISKDRAEESDRLKTAFLQNLSHEIRTPMNAIMGFTNLLSKSDLSTEEQLSYIEIIQSSSNQLLTIVDDIITTSRLETKQMKVNEQTVNLKEIFANLSSVYLPEAENKNLNFDFRNTIIDEHSVVITDKEKLYQVLSKIISNAIKFTNTGGVEVYCSSNTNTIQFSVKDSGVGIPNEAFASIFDRFRQVDISMSRQYGGTGLGLSIAKAYVELLGGKIWVDSEIDVGSTFYFTIPLKLSRSISAAKPLFENSKKKSLKILVAEDEYYNFQYLREILNYTNIEVLHAKNGLEAVQFCETHSDIDLVLMDIKMPLMDGKEAMMQIKKIRPNLKIVAQTAYALVNDKKDLLDSGFDDYISKPISRDDVFGTINKLVTE